MSDPTPGVISRWRLVLGRYSQQRLGELGGEQRRLDRALDFLYAREYAGRGVRGRPATGQGAGPGSLDPSQLLVPRWLDEVRTLFPKETVQVIERHALERYGLTEILKNRETLSRIEPSFDLLKVMLELRGHVKGDLLAELRRIIGEVVEKLRHQLEADVKRALAGRVHRFLPGRVKVARNLDWKQTIRRNLKNWDSERQQLVIDTPRFFSRIQRQMPWDVIVCVDQSASMAGSIIHAAVMASIMAGLPSLCVKLVVFDTSVVDLTDHVDDPIETLMSVQLGGGTDIGRAIRYCEQLVRVPQRTILVLISDFCEGASPRRLLAAVRRLHEAGVTQLGLAALEEDANPSFDRAMAERLSAVGMDVAALTPRELAQWVMGVISGRG
jgi:Mg-chelatase subunit ChlD